MVRTFQEIPSHSLRLLVFDLDGTLIDSVADLCAAVNAMLRHFGRPPLPQGVIAGYIGNGAPMLVRRALGEQADPAFLDSALTYFLRYYNDHKLDQTFVYPGVFEALRSLQLEANGVERSMAVLTNKPVGASQGICDALGLSPYFFRIYGGNSFTTKKPEREGLDALIREAGVTPEETLMIGDSSVDILTARNAGTWSMGCSFGLAPETLEAAQPDCIVDSPNEWPLALRDGSLLKKNPPVAFTMGNNNSAERAKLASD
jgi:phosphoglycolate phosphatase